MPNNYLSVLNKHIIQVENKNVGLKVGGGGHKHTIAPPIKKVGGGAHAPPASYASDIYIYIYINWRRKRGRGGGQRGVCAPPRFWLGGGGQWYVCAPPLLTPHFYFPLELYVYITLTNNYLAFFIYQLIILWTISINWHRWLLLNNHTSKYNSFILVLYRRYKNHVSPPPPTHTHTHFLAHCYATVCVLLFFVCSLCCCLFVCCCFNESRTHNLQ